jgi:simple sugar transport system permease protein
MKTFARQALAVLLPPFLAILAALALFSLFLASQGVNPLDAYGLIWLGAFGTWFSWQNTLVRAAPLLLTGLCVALPAQMGLLIIGGEGAFVLGGLAAVAAGLPLDAAGWNSYVVLIIMALAGIATGGALIAFCGILRFRRGVNETISSLLLAYISIAVMNQIVEGPMRDPASLNRPSTPTLPSEVMIGDIGNTSIHWGFVFGVVACLAAYFVVYFTKFGFAARIVGGNPRAGRVVGLPVERMIVAFCAAAGGAAGLAGMVEVAAVQGAASADLATGVGYTGILVAFLARMNPLAMIPVAILLGGLDAAGGLLQQRLGLPDATMLVFRGVLFVALLSAEALQGRLARFLPAALSPSSA